MTSTSRPGPLTQVSLGFGDHATTQTALAMAQTIDQSSANPQVRLFAEHIIQQYKVAPRDKLGEARAIFAYVRDHTRFTNDPKGWEFYKTPPFIISQIEAGRVPMLDCDDMTVFGLSLLKSLGFETKLKMTSYRQNGEYQHVFGLVDVNGQWLAFDAVRPFMQLGIEGGTPTRSVEIPVPSNAASRMAYRFPTRAVGLGDVTVLPVGFLPPNAQPNVATPPPLSPESILSVVVQFRDTYVKLQAKADSIAAQLSTLAQAHQSAPSDLLAASRSVAAALASGAPLLQTADENEAAWEQLGTVQALSDHDRQFLGELGLSLLPSAVSAALKAATAWVPQALAWIKNALTLLGGAEVYHQGRSLFGGASAGGGSLIGSLFSFVTSPLGLAGVIVGVLWYTGIIHFKGGR